MSTRRTNVPAIPEIASTAESIDRTLRALKEATEVGYGRRGDRLDRFVTLRDLQDGGVARVDGAGGGVVLGPSLPGAGAPLPEDITPPDYGEDDYTPPPTPRNVVAKGLPPDIDDEGDSLGLVMLTWDAPDYHNHYYAEIYRIPWGAGNNHDADGKPLFVIESHGFHPAYAYGVDRGDGQPNQINGGPAVLAGTAEGTIFVDRDLPPVHEDPHGDELDNALNPGRYFYWVRFVSRAMVPGPLSDRAEASLSISPAQVLDAMTRNVTSTGIFRHLREWLDLGSPEAQAGGGILSYIDTAIDESGIKSIWSVRMQHQLGNGLTYAAGFGLGMETDSETGRSLSTFLVNANQFAIMGPQGGVAGARIVGMARISTIDLDVTLQTAGHGFNVGAQVTVAGPPGKVRVGDIEYPQPNENNPFPVVSGVDAEVVAVSGARVTIRRPSGTWPQMFGWINPTSSGYERDAVMAMNAVLMPAASIPFIVDTTRNVVGIRGSLIVDGLVRGTTGEFNTLTANTAFIQKLQAEVVNANVVIAQRIIAGTTGYAPGPITTSQYNAISNYILELNNPSGTASQFPLRFWKPGSGASSTVFSLSNQGNMFVGGHMSVGGSGVISGGGAETNPSGYLLSTGGTGADGGRWPLWIGPRFRYGSAGEGRRERYGDGSAEPLFWIKDNGRAGFNADVFLADDPIVVPSVDGSIAVRPQRNGAASAIFASATVTLIREAEDGMGGADERKWFGVEMWLVDQSAQGNAQTGNVNPTWIHPGMTPAFLNRHIIFLGQHHSGPPGAVRRLAAQGIDIKAREITVTIQGSTTVAAGNYKVMVCIFPKGSSGAGANINGYGALGAYFYVQQVRTPEGGIPVQALGGLIPVVEGRTSGGVESPDWIVASEDILKGSFVNIHEVDGFARIRRADSTIPYRADGWLMYSAREGDRVQVYREGINPYLEGLTVGDAYVLGTNGKAVREADSIRPIQYLGKALTGTSLLVSIDSSDADIMGAAPHISAQSAESFTMLRGTPVALVSGKLRRASALPPYNEVVGLVMDDEIEGGASGRVQTGGTLSQSVSGWESVTGLPGGLAADAMHYLSPTGTLTPFAPGGSGEVVAPVGRAASATDFVIDIDTQVHL